MKFKEKRKIDEESQDNLRERYKTLSEMLKDQSTDEETRKAVIEEMKFIKSQEKERRFEKINAGPIIGGIISGLSMLLVGLIKYGLDNKGLYSKSGDNMLDERNYKKL